ncbi:hypothetical protein K438DRAFT_1926039 [Mycena galopus ATCC 62051]|nr:hypothetical protein K438DRAFT_1926039 [Mycena galopus ATCC 62051]
MTTTLIPRPKWCSSKAKRVKSEEIRAAMPGWTPDKFQAFTEYIQSRAHHHGLNTYSLLQVQDPIKREKLLNDCRQKFPELGDFDKDWPVDAYYTKWVSRRDLEKKQREKAKDSQPGPNSTKRKAPKRGETGKENVEYASSSTRDPEQAQVYLQAAVSKMRMYANPTRPYFAINTSNLPAVFQPTGVVVFVSSGPCVFCGYQPLVPAEETAKLHQCLNNHTDLLTRLAHAGVVADHHFCILLRLSKSRQNDFLSALASADKLTWVERVEIEEVLEVYLEKNPDLSFVERPRKVRLTAVRRPKEGLENILAVHTCKHSDVQRHLRIEDDAEYFDLVDLVERWSPLYLDTSIPFGEQDEDTLDTLVGLISEEKPYLRKYDDCWPVYLLIRRFLCARAAGLPRTPRESTAAGGPATANAPPQHQCPKLLTYPPSNVPPSITALLEDCCMEELGPAFLFLGFSSDKKFTSIFTSRRAKANLLDKLPARVLECSEFQSLMLRYVIEHA